MLPFDVSIIGIVFSLILFIIFFSAVILYLAFRIKETFRKEKKKGIVAAKIAFLIGILFLAGGIFYFFAGNLIVIPPSNEPNRIELSLSISNPSSAKMNTQIVISFTITNPTDEIAHQASIQAGELLQDLLLLSTTHNVEGNVITVGDISPGTTICSINVVTPVRPTDIQGTITMTYQEMEQPISEEIIISVKGKP